MDIDQKKLFEILKYDPETGVFTWRKTRSGINSVIDVGYVSPDGYLLICINYKRYLGHRLAWLWVHGVFPKMIDHKNMNRLDNRIKNLRETTQSQNLANRRKNKNNKSGFKGVTQSTRNPTHWYAHIRKNYKKFYIGTYNSAEKAHAAYLAEAKKLFREFARAS